MRHNQDQVTSEIKIKEEKKETKILSKEEKEKAREEKIQLRQLKQMKKSDRVGSKTLLKEEAKLGKLALKEEKRMAKEVKKQMENSDHPEISKEEPQTSINEEKLAKIARKEEKRKEREEKHQMKHMEEDHKESDKDLEKAEKKLAKLALKEEKRKAKEEKHQMKMNHEFKEKTPKPMKEKNDKHNKKEKAFWPENCEQVFVDGNHLKDICVFKKMMKDNRSEEIDSILINICGKIVSDQLKHTTLVFNETQSILQRGEKFSIIAAKPAMASSDVALTAMALFKPNDDKKWLFVTPNQELVERLKQFPNIIVWKPQKLFRYFAKENNEAPKEWIRSFIPVEN